MAQLPQYLADVEISTAQRNRILKFNSNWNTLYSNLLVGYREPEVMLRIMKIEMERPEPRKGLLSRLLGKYSTCNRERMQKQVNATLKQRSKS